MEYNIVINGNTYNQISTCWYQQNLNSMSMFQATISGGDTLDFDIDPGEVISIYRNGVLEFKGVIDDIEKDESGTLTLSGNGYEVLLGDEYCTQTAETSTASATLFGTLIGFSNNLSAGTINAGTDVDFRASDTSTIWNAICDLIVMSGQFINIDYTNDEIDILTTKGTANIAYLNEGADISNITFNKLRIRGKKVIVYGKGDGDTQISATAEAGTYIAGDPIYKIKDPNVMTPTQAQLRADNELKLLEKNIRIYEFQLVDPDIDIQTGDTFTINAPSVGLDNEEVSVRIVRRGFNENKDYLTVQVSNSEMTQLQRSNTGQIRRSVYENNASMQGTTNILTYDNVRNANDTTSLIIKCPIPESLCFDEAGNRRITSMLIDYDVDPFNKSFGSVTQSNVAPAVTGNTDDNDTYIVVGTDTDTDDGGETLTHNTTSTTFPVTLGTYTPSSHGQYMIIYVHYKLFSQSAPTGTGEVYLRVNDGTYYYPMNTGARIFRGKTELDLADGDTDSDTHYHGPSGGFNYLVVSSNLIDFYGEGATDSDTHDHDVDGNTTIYPQGVLTFLCPGDPNNVRYDVDARFYQGTGNTIDIAYQIKFAVDGRHEHDAGNNLDAASHNHSVSIGDSISDADSINATEVNLYLDYLELKDITNNESSGAGVVVEMTDTGKIAIGDIVYFNSATPAQNEWCTVTGLSANTSITVTLTSNKTAGDSITWVNKHSVLATGKTLDTNVDITDSNTYPDYYGSWRVRILTDSNDGDLLLGVAKVKHQMDN